jgi:LysR family transcriptional regulator, cyn operon transcriptional activator
MDLRQFEMVIAVAENASFTRAGEQLHVAQSAISRKIRLLEEELGEPLFKRVSRRVYLTPAGETLLFYARKVFQDLRNAAVEISELTRLERGRLRIGAGMLACTYLLPPVLEKFKALYPRVDLHVSTGPTDVLLSKLCDNSIELGVFTLPIRRLDLTVLPMWKEEMVVATSVKHPVLAKRQSIRAEEMDQYPLITFPRESHTRATIDAFFGATGVTPKIAMEAENVAMIKPLVKIDLGISIVPLRAIAEEVRRRELHCLRISDHNLTREVGIVYQPVDPLPRVLSELVRLLKEQRETAN